jgi:hypothetical protein
VNRYELRVGKYGDSSGMSHLFAYFFDLEKQWYVYERSGINEDFYDSLIIYPGNPG